MSGITKPLNSRLVASSLHLALYCANLGQTATIVTIPPFQPGSTEDRSKHHSNYCRPSTETMLSNQREQHWQIELKCWQQPNMSHHLSRFFSPHLQVARGVGYCMHNLFRSTQRTLSSAVPSTLCRNVRPRFSGYARSISTPAYEGHIPVNWFENAFLAVGSAVMSLVDPRRGGAEIYLQWPGGTLNERSKT